MSTLEEEWAAGPSLIASVWRYRYAVAVFAVIAGVLGYWLSSRQPAVYAATAQMFLADPRNTAVFDSSRPVIDPERYVPQQSARVTSRPVLARAVDALEGLEGTEALRETIEVSGDVQLNTITVTAYARDPERAAVIANTVAQAYMNEVAARTNAEAQDAVDSVRRQLSGLELTAEQQQQLDAQAAQAQINAALFGDGVQVFESALPPAGPTAPSPARDAVLAALLGGAIAAAVAYWAAGRSQRAVTRSDPARILGAPLLGEVPVFKLRASGTLAERFTPPPPPAEAYQFVLSSLEFALAEVSGRTVLVTSAAPGDGKTTTALQLARAAARDEGRVVLADADIRARGLSRMLGAEGHRGLAEVAAHEVGLDAAMMTLQLEPKVRLPFLGSGRPPSDATSFFRSSGFTGALDRMRQRAELVVLDSSPLLSVADTSIIANHVDGIVLVVTRGTPLDQLQQVRQRLAFVSAPLLGYVYNRSDSSGLEGYGYAYAENGQGGPPGRRGKRQAGEWRHEAATKTASRTRGR